MWKTCPRWTSSSGKSSFIVIPVDGLTLYLSHACDNLCSRTIVLLSCDISPLCDVAQTSDCGVFLFLTLNIRPLCDVAQTSDCGMHYLLFPIISPLCGVALTPDCGIVILAFSSRGVIQTLVWPSVFILRFREDYRPTSPYFPYALLSLCLSALVNPIICIMFTFVISYVRTVLRVLS